MEEKFASRRREFMIDFTLASVCLSIAGAFVSYLLIASFVADADPLLIILTIPGGLVGFVAACIMYRRQPEEF